MKNEIKDYLRIGTDYYRIIKNHTLNSEILRITPWNKQTILDDFKDKSIIDKVSKYDAFCNIPAHINYSRVIGNSYNRYEPLEIEPIEGVWTNTKQFLEHIFDEQYTLGLDYLTILYRFPKRHLPILCLVSKERKTGKSTFINWLRDIYSFNLTINTNEDLRGRFNSDWANKLIIAIEETFLEKKEDSERLKQLSTGKSVKMERKGIDKVEGDFFAKFILCSNNEENFVWIDELETRYWVRKINPFEKENNNLNQILKTEIPAFLYFLATREINSEDCTRSWFNENLLQTDALLRLKRGNKSGIEKVLQEIIEEKLEDFSLSKIQFTNQDLLAILKENRVNTNRYYLSKILSDKFKIAPSKSTTYYTYFWDASNEQVLQNSKKGRVFTFTKETFSKL